jgi:F-type H+-transporting ATPase subunit delta
MAARYTRPYVDALFAVATPKDAETLRPVLDRFAALLTSSKEIEGFFRNPAVPRERKRGLLDALAKRAGVDGLALRLLHVLLGNGRILRTAEIAKAIQERLDRDQNAVEARLVTPSPLGEAEAEGIRVALEGRTGRTVRLTRSVDPALLGGFVVRVGSEVYDASLAQRLRKTRQALHQRTGSAEGHHG